MQDYKLVLARRRADGALVAGEELRTVLNIPKKSAKKVTVDLDNIPDFDIFVQSTSYNRVLLPGTKLLYKMEEKEVTWDFAQKELAPNMQEMIWVIWIHPCMWPPGGTFVVILPVYCYGGTKH